MTGSKSSNASTFVVKIAKPAGGGKAGKDAAGLLRYLYGPGRSDEHTDQHAVAGSMGLVMAYPGALSSREATGLGRTIELSWRHQYADQLALVGATTGSAGGGSHLGGVPRSLMPFQAGPAGVPEAEKEYAYHLIVSLPPGAGWDDEQWATAAQDVVTGMGFSDGPDDEAGCRWVAVRHGLSAGGNDHLHVVVNLVRQDGRRASTHNDFVTARTVRHHIEATRDFALPLHDVGKEPARTLPAYTMAEHRRSLERAATSGRSLPDRTVLQQALRAATGVASTEAQWIAAVLDAHPDIELTAARWASHPSPTDGTSPGAEVSLKSEDRTAGDVRSRAGGAFAEQKAGRGGREVVTGYKVRLGDGPWFSASSLAPDLTLQKLRPTWQAQEDDTSRAHAAALWREETQLPDTTLAGGGGGVAVSAHLDAAGEDLAAWARELAGVDPYNTTTWEQALRDAAAVASALGGADGRAGRDLATVGQILTRQTLATAPTVRSPGFPVPPSHHATDSMLGIQRGPGSVHAHRATAQVQRALRASSPDSHLGWMAVLQQMRAVVAAIEDAQQARGELARARQLAAAVGGLDTAVTVGDATWGGHDPDELGRVLAAREATRLSAASTPGPGGSLTADAPTSPSGKETHRQLGRAGGIT